MAILNCSYHRLLLYAVFVLYVYLPFCLSAVENCRPCGPGEYCSKFFGICLACKDYCPGDADCPRACTPIKPYIATFAPTTTGPTSIQSDTTSQSMASSTSSVASSVVVQQSTNANISSGGDNTFVDNGKGYLVLPVWLIVVLSILPIPLCIILIVLCLKYRKKLKMPSIYCFSSGDSDDGTDIELGERPRSNRYHQTTGGYATVKVDDVDGHDIINQPGPSRPNSSRPSRLPGPNAEAAAPADPTHSASGSRKTPDRLDANRPFQSASVHKTNTPLLQESETPQGACPFDRRSFPKKTPETHRKISDGTHEGHVISTGASPFNPPNGMCEDIQLDHQFGHGD